MNPVVDEEHVVVASRPRCGTCSRFVPFATVQILLNWGLGGPGIASATAECRRCGRAELDYDSYWWNGDGDDRP